MACDIKSLVKKFLHYSWSQGDLSRIERLATNNFFYKTTFTDEILSLSEYHSYISGFREAMPNLMLHTEEIMVEGNRAMTHISFHGIVTKPIYGIPASDSIIAFEAASIWEIKADKVYSLNTLLDIRGIERQLKATLPKNPLTANIGY